MKETTQIGVNSCTFPLWKDKTPKFKTSISKKEVVIKKIVKTVELDLSEYVGQKLMDARKAVNMTQKDVEKATGILRTSLSKIERGGQSPNVNLLYILCALYKCNSQEILPF